MAESGDESDVPLVVLAHYNDMTVLQKGRSFQYTIPSFPVFTVMLREVKLQWEDDNGDLHLFDGFMREYELLNHPLPAITRIPHGYKHAFLAEVCQIRTRTRCMHVHLSRPHKKQPLNIILMTRKTRVACMPVTISCLYYTSMQYCNLIG